MRTATFTVDLGARVERDIAIAQKGMDWEVLENGEVTARFLAQLQADLYARAESKMFPGNFYLIRHSKNPEGNKSAIIHEGRTYVRHG